MKQQQVVKSGQVSKRELWGKHLARIVGGLLQSCCLLSDAFSVQIVWGMIVGNTMALSTSMIRGGEG